MSIQRFEDILAWQKARELTRLIYVMTSAAGFTKDFGLKDQIQRSAVSVMSNIAEGFGRKTDKEFLQFLFIALGSNTELQSQLYIAVDIQYITKDEFDKALFLSHEVSKLLTKFTQYLKKTP